MAKWLVNPISYDCARLGQEVVIIEKMPHLDEDAPPLPGDSVGFPQCCSGMQACRLFWSDRFPPIGAELIATGCPFIDTRRMAVAM